ncbi:MAG: O-antigen ligase family protein [Xanthobacteraceae bacterium]
MLLAAVFLLVWISFRPFENLSTAQEVTETGNLVNQIGYSLLFLLLAAWCLGHDASRLLVLLRPVLIITLLWFALCVVTSWDPSLSARRFAFTLVTVGLAGMALLLPNNVRHFSDVMAVVVLIVLATCYLGVFLLPEQAIHQTTDYIEPELAGDWRGVFSHKNEASAAMVLFVFIGLFIARVRSVRVGTLIVALALAFLVFTKSKTSIAMLPITLIVSALLTRIHRPVAGISLTLFIVVAFNILSIGSIYLEPVRDLLDMVLTDTSFTGRTDIWQFALDRVAQRPITGHGFAAFWGTKQVVYGMSGTSIWANTAAHAHNAYLNLALTVGIPGSILATLWLVVLPVVDFFRSADAPAAAPLKMLFLRVCLFAAFGSCFESMLIEESTLGLFLFMAAFGLRLLSVSRVTA